MPLVMKENGNLEFEEPFIKHECKNKDWSCFQYRYHEKLTLRLSIPQCCHDDEYDISVLICPFCGYKVNNENS
jgi:hypothetical protein